MSGKRLNSSQHLNAAASKIPMAYGVYIVEYHGARNHVVIFVENGAGGSGTKYHVTGTVLMGMSYEFKEAAAPKHDEAYVPGSRRLVGWMAETDIARVDEVCRSVPPPGPQVKLNGKPKDPSKPVRRCGEWVENAKEKLLAEGIVVCEGADPLTD